MKSYKLNSEQAASMLATQQNNIIKEQKAKLDILRQIIEGLQRKLAAAEENK